MTAVNTCKSCKWCVLPTSGDINSAHCAVVIDPVTGDKLDLRVARLDTWEGHALPCGYAGAKWTAI